MPKGKQAVIIAETDSDSIEPEQNLSEMIDNTQIQHSESELFPLYSQLTQHALVQPRKEYEQQIIQQSVKIQADKFASEFSTILINTDWESTTYQCVYGIFSVKLTVLWMSTKSQHFTRNYHNKIGNGQFGCVYMLSVGSFKYAVKNIQIKQKDKQYMKKVNKALQQVMLTKICSILKVGSQFANFFGYDAIIFENGVHFVMQMCQKPQVQNFITLQKMKVNLLSSLRVLHMFNICHLDIKPENIVWSNSYQKYVFIDYGFAGCFKQTAGAKSYIKYRGTFKYSSPEFKKLYYLEKSGLADVYYNDLHCLEKAVRQFDKFDQVSLPSQLQFYDFPQVSRQYEAQQIQFEKAKQIQFDEQTEAISSFFLLRFYLFMEELTKIQQILKSKKTIPVFDRLLAIEVQKKKNCPLGIKLRQLKQLTKDCSVKNESISQLNSFLLNYIFSLQIYNMPTLEKLLQISETKVSDHLLNHLWVDENQMANILSFLDVYNSKISKMKENRKKLIINLYRILVNHDQKKSLTLKLRDVLLYFFQFFKQKHNCAAMKKIQCYFLMLNDIYNADRMQIEILNSIQNDKKVDYVELVKSNLEFFFGKIILIQKVDCVYGSNNQNRIENAVSKMAKVYHPLIHFASSCINLIRHIKQKYSFPQFSNVQFMSQQEAHFYLANYSPFLSSDLQKLVRYFLTASSPLKTQQNILELARMKFDSQYLSCSQTKNQINIFAQTQQYEKIKRLLETEPFWSEFRTFYEIYLFPFISNSLSFSEFWMFEKHCFQLHQSDLTKIRSILGRQKYECFLIGYLAKLEEIDSPEKVRNCFRSLSRILLSMADYLNRTQLNQMEHLFLLTEEGPVFHRILNSVESFIEEKYATSSMPEEYSFELGYFYQINQSLIHILRRNLYSAVKLLCSIAKQTSSVMPISLLSRIYLMNMVSTQLKKSIENELYIYILNIFNSSRLYLLLYAPDLFPTMIPSLYNSKGLQFMYSMLKTFFKLIYNQTQFSQNNRFFRVLINFTKALTKNDKIYLIEKLVAHENLMTFEDCYILLPMILNMFISLISFFDRSLQQRILFICAHFAPRFLKNQFRSFKNVLSRTSYSLKGKSSDKKFENRRFGTKSELQNKINDLKIAQTGKQSGFCIAAQYQILRRLKTYVNQSEKEQQLSYWIGYAKVIEFQ